MVSKRARAMQARTNGAHRATEDAGDGRVRQLFEIAQRDDFAMLQRQFEHGAAERGRDLRARDFVGGRGFDAGVRRRSVVVGVERDPALLAAGNGG